MRSGRTRIALTAVVASLVLAIPGAAGAATTVGDTYAPPEDDILCSAGFTRLQIVSPGDQYEIPFAGVITSWSFFGAVTAEGGPPRLELKVGRDAGGGAWRIVGESAPETPTEGLNTFPTDIIVNAGDVIGNYTHTDGECSSSEPPFFDVVFGYEDVPPGGTLDIHAPGTLLDISAQVEPFRCAGRDATIAGTEGRDRLVGTAGDDVITGLGGKDKIKGLGGDDRLCGKGGKDNLKGGVRNDVLKGGAKPDRLNGGGGDDKCAGGGGADTAKKCEVERSL